MAHHHMAATANPMASSAALSVLRDHGTAVDAAIAAQMVLAVVEPQASGLGGGALMLSWTAAPRRLTSFEGLSAAPADVPDDLLVGGVSAEDVKRSGLAVGVPGVLRMLALAHAQSGQMSWARLLRDAVGLAEHGFPLPPYLHQVLARHAGLAEVAGLARVYFDADHRVLPVGTMLRNPAQAALLRAIAAGGPEAFYRGPIAAGVRDAVDQAGLPGRMSLRDLADYRARERAPLCDPAFGHRICTAPPPSGGGIAVLQQLRLLERLGIARAAAGSPEAVHLFLEAGRLARADRIVWVGDPDQVVVPTAGLLEAGYIASRAALVDPAHAMYGVTAGQPVPHRAQAPPGEPLALPATSHIAVVDDAGDAVSLTTTINLDFGAWLTADGAVLNDGLTNFAEPSAKDGVRAANAIAAHKRPVSTMAPSIVFGADQRPQIVLGAGGGERIIDAVAESLTGMLAWRLDIRAAISQPRYGAQSGRQELEAGTAAAELAAPLEAMGHTVQVDVMNAAVQGISITPAGLAGWGDAHRDGVALGD